MRRSALRVLAFAVAVCLSAPGSAAAEDYLGMGDSYSSGNGTGTGTGDCVRSPDAFAPRIDPAVPGSFKFVACSGAQTGNITTSGQNGEARQVDNLTPTTKYVTLNIGGNDAGFTSILTACAYSDCNADFDEAQRFIREDLPARLKSVFDAIKARSPQARIVLLGYPRLFSPQNSCIGDFLYSSAEKQRGNDTADQLAEVERRVTRENGFTYVDPRPAFIGHAVCDDPEWINGFKATEFSGSFHPKIVAHDHFVPMVQAALLAAPDPTVTRGPRARVAFVTARDGNDEVYAVNRDGTFPVNLTNNAGGSDVDPAWSPDGQKIAFASKRGGDGDYEIYVANADGSGATRLTNNPTDDREPTWAPDGDYIAYRSATGIVSMTSGGASPVQLTTNPQDTKPEWSPDGAEIAFGRSGDIYRMNADGQGQTDLTPSTSSTEAAPAWAPSGLRVAFSSSRTGAGDIYTIDANGETAANPAIRLTSDPAAESDPVYSPDGSQIAFTRGATQKLFTMTSAGASQAALSTGSATADLTPSWQADSAAPDTSFTSGPAGPTNAVNPSFGLASTEPGSTFSCTVDSRPAVSCSSPFTVPAPALGEGPHTVSVNATDPVGNVDPTQATRSFTVDLTPPDTTLNSGPSGTTGDNTPTWSFSSSEPGSAFACRVDGASFAACSSPFTSSTLGDGAHTFEVRALDVAGNPDPTPASASFTVDTAVPDINLDSAPGALTNQSTGAIAFSSPTATSFECSLDAAAFASCSSPVAFGPLSDGQHSFRIRGTDSLGNTGTTELSFSVDTVAPDTQFSSGPAGPVASAAQTFAFGSPEAGVAFECRIDSSQPGDFAPCSSPLTRTFADGPHSIEVRALDSAGNRDATPALRAFTVDTTPPDTEITQHPDAAARSNVAPFPFSFTSPDATASYRCKLDDEPYSSCSSPKAVSVTGNGGQAPINGEHTFFVRATDAVGNTDPAPATYSFVIDGSVPSTTITDGPANNGWATQADANPGKGIASFGFVAAATEQNPVYECSLDGAAFASCISPVTYQGLDDGSQHTFKVHTLDAVGPGPDQTRTFKVDVTDPLTTITGGPAGTVANSNAPFTYSSEAGATFQCAIDSGAFTSCPSTGRAYPGQAEGPHTFSVKATALSGRTEGSAATRSFTVDATPPHTTFTSGPSGPTSSATPTFAFSSNESGSTFVCSVDSGAFAPCTSPSTVPAPLAEGDHTFRVRATDAVGNGETNAATREFTVDLTSPDTAITTGPSGLVASAAQTFSFSSGDAAATFECSLDSAPFTPCSPPRALTGLGDGAHLFGVRAVDPAGNADPTPASRAFTVDTVAPETTISSGPDGVAGTATPSFAFAASEPGTLECRVDAAPFAPCASPLTLPAQAAGGHRFEVRAVDGAGNRDASPEARDFTVAATSPAAGVPKILTGAARASKSGVVSLRVGCSAGPCSGTLSLRTAAKLRVGNHKAQLPLGKASFEIGAGATAKVGVKLSPKALAMLRASGKLSAEAGTAPAVTKRKVLIRAA